MTIEQAKAHIEEMKTKTNKTQADIANFKIALNIVAGSWAGEN